MKWVKWRYDGHSSSWHRIAFESRGGTPKTLCGRWARGVLTRGETFDANDKTCESCLRLDAATQG